MKKILIICLFISFAACKWMQSVEGAEYQLNENKRIEGKISATEPNRIRIENDRIVEIIGLGEDYVLESDEKLGQIFIKAKEGATDAIFTIITEKGFVQDFKLMARGKLSGQIIFVKNKEAQSLGDAQEMRSQESWNQESQLSNKMIGTKHIRHDEIVSFIKYNRWIAKEEKEGDSKQGAYRDGNLSIKYLGSKKSGRYELEIWGLRNISKKAISLREKQFYTGKSIAAIMIEDREVGANENTRLYKVIYHG